MKINRNVTKVDRLLSGQRPMTPSCRDREPATICQTSVVRWASKHTSPRPARPFQGPPGFPDQTTRP